VFFLPERQQVIGYPISGFNNDLRPGHRRYNFIWYRVGDAATLKEMCVDQNGRQHDYSVPPPLIRDDLIAQMRAEAEAIMPDAFIDCLRKIERPFFTPIYDFAAPSIVFSRVVLVGDAGSSSRPHMGFGVAKAGGDAQALADALATHDDIDVALAAYDTLRQPIGERIMMHGRKLGTHLGVDLRTAEDRRMWKLLQEEEAMMDWIAVPNFLAAYR
jgi:2-polyprenyl-6-methoxyphenol hydroxylase-like FAD-dependent oxidoreductase